MYSLLKCGGLSLNSNEDKKNFLVFKVNILSRSNVHANYFCLNYECRRPKKLSIIFKLSNLKTNFSFFFHSTTINVFLLFSEVNGIIEF